MTAIVSIRRVQPAELAEQWPTEPVPELLARVEELISLAEDGASEGDEADEVIFQRIRRYARSLDLLDRYGMLRGPIRARYQAAILAAAR